MHMAGDDDKDKKGFFGISDLVSEISGLDDPVSPEAISETKPTHGTPGQKGTPRTEPQRKPTTFPSPIETGGSGWKWILGIVGVIVLISIWIANNGGQDTKEPSPNISPPTFNTYESRPSRSTLAQEIENGKVRAKQMEAQIRDMDDRLYDLALRMRTYMASGMTDEYNMLVPLFNALVVERNNLYEEYKILIDVVNFKVRLYNAGYR